MINGLSIDWPISYYSYYASDCILAAPGQSIDIIVAHVGANQATKILPRNQFYPLA